MNITLYLLNIIIHNTFVRIRHLFVSYFSILCNCHSYELQCNLLITHNQYR